MNQDTLIFILLAVGALAIAIGIFVTAMWLVESARKGNRIHKWSSRKWASRFLRHPK